MFTFPDTSTITYSYDAGDRPIQIADSINGTITRTYNGRDNLLSEVSPQGTVSYGYDVLGRRTSMTVTGRAPITYTYDDANRLSTITRGAIVATIAYDDSNRPISRSMSTGLLEQIIWSGGYVGEVRYSQSGTFIGNLTYSYDSGGKRTQVGGSLATINLPAPVSSASYNDADRLTVFGAQGFTYDNAGNLLSDGVSTYTWDGRGQLSSITGPATASFQYDPLGRRVGGLGASEVYDGWNIAGQSNGGNTVSMITGDVLDDVLWRTDAFRLSLFHSRYDWQRGWSGRSIRELYHSIQL